MARKVCKQHFTTHGQSKSRLYRIWAGVIKRCNNSNASNFERYGARGITVCETWRSFQNFQQWSENNGYTDEKSIDRIDVNGNYSPDNCRWVDKRTQANNRTTNVYFTHNGETHTIAEWARIMNVPYQRLHKQLRTKKLSPEVVFNNL